MQGGNAALRVKSLELRVKIWYVRLRGHIFIECDIGAGHAPPATVCYNEYYGLACRGGIYAARCSRPGNAT